MMKTDMNSQHGKIKQSEKDRCNDAITKWLFFKKKNLILVLDYFKTNDKCFPCENSHLHC